MLDSECGQNETWGSLLRAPIDSMSCQFAASSYWNTEQLRNRSVTGTLSNKCRSLGRTVPKPQLTPEKVSSLKAAARFCTTFKCSVPYKGKQIFSKPCDFIMCMVVATSWSKPFTGRLSCSENYSIYSSLLKMACSACKFKKCQQNNTSTKNKRSAALKLQGRNKISAKIAVASCKCNVKPNLCLACECGIYFIAILCR